MSTPQDPPYPMPPPFPAPRPDARPNPDEDDPPTDPLPSAGGYTLKFTPSPDAEKRFAEFVEWLLKIDNSDRVLRKIPSAKAKLVPAEVAEGS